MNKKLPEIFKNNDKIESNNKKSYYSYAENERIVSPTNDNYSAEKKNDLNNFFQYFNKRVDIELDDGNITNTKILSKIDNRILLENGSYLDISKIKNIK